jgi:hypothetical protein
MRIILRITGHEQLTIRWSAAAIAAGTLHPFICPVTAQDGSTVECKGGTHLATSRSSA